MKEQKEYYPLIDDQKSFHLNILSGANYKRLKMVYLKSSIEPVSSKAAILKELKADKKEITDELSVERVYEMIASIIFLEKHNFSFDKMNLSEVNRAHADFFSQLTQK